jgi:hypothetical protein
MRIRKPRGKQKGRATLSENEIVEACDLLLRKRGYEPGVNSWLVIPGVEPAGGRRKVQVVVEIDRFPATEH